MKISVYETPEEIDKVVKEVLENKVVLHNWGSMYKWWYKPELIETLAIAEVDNEKVGAVMVSNESEQNYYFNLSVFVSPYHRRKGIGGKLLQAIKHTKNLFRVDSSEFRKAMFQKYLEGKIQ